MFGNLRFIVIFIAIVVLPLAIFIGTASAETWYVDDDGADFTSIQDAIDNAMAGDTIIVKDGTYTENVDVNKRLTIRSENGVNSTMVKAVASDDHVFEVTTGYVDISGFMVTGATGYLKAGIYLAEGTDHCTISNNYITNNYHGIHLYSSNENSLASNVASNNRDGVYLYESSSNNNLVSNTVCSNNGDGIHLYRSSSNTLKNNNASNNWNGIYLYEVSNDNKLEDNTACSNNGDGMYIWYSNNSYIKNNDVNLNSGNGMSLWYSNENEVKNNNLNSNNLNGIYLYESGNSMLANNTANSNNENGICLWYSDNNGINNNYVNSNKEYGVYLIYSSGNTISGNKGPVYSESVSCENNVEYENKIDVERSIYTESTETWYVDDDGGANFTRIQDAINYASSGDIIIVKEGTYNENIDVNKRLTIRSENGPLSTTVIASNSYDHVFDVTVGYVNISGFMIEGATGSRKAGIRLHFSDYCNISGNIVSKNYYGIYLRSSSNNTLVENIMSDNDYTLSVYGYSLSHFTNSIDTTNKINGRPVYYWVGRQDQKIPGDAGYVGVVNSTNITVKDLTLTGNGQGVLFAYTDNSKIENVNVSNNGDYGIWLDHSNNNTLGGNTVSDNWHGTYLEDSSNNTLSGNSMEGNDVGIYLRKSSNNTLRDNNASNNLAGIILDSSSNYNTLAGNTVGGNNYGIQLYSSSSNTIANNNVKNNDKFGIYLEWGSRDNKLTNNDGTVHNERSTIAIWAALILVILFAIVFMAMRYSKSKGRETKEESLEVGKVVEDEAKVDKSKRKTW
ncbi:MAG: NosD domain-containing protein [Halobacteriota archaeon]|nr:NosD domain-containing protein [Halobacteriota archaeon]